MSTSAVQRPAVLITIAVLAGALVAGILALVTFGAQATTTPDGLPVAVAVPEQGPAAENLHQAAERVAAQGEGQLSWQITTPEQARTMLYDKDVYGVLELGAGPAGPQATVLVSGAINPSGTQIAQQALTGAGQAVTAAIASQAPQLTPSPVRVEQLNQATPAGRVAPLAISALAWIGCLVAGIALTVLAERRGVQVGAGGRLLTAAAVSVVLTGVIAGFLRLWDSDLPLGWDVLGMIAMTALAFASLQGGLLHWLGIPAVAILAPLYLIAPSVAGQVPELLHPGYRVGLWSWTPFRFSTEALRSLLQGTPDAPDVGIGLWVLGGMLLAGAVLLAIPKRGLQPRAATASPERVLSGT